MTIEADLKALRSHGTCCADRGHRLAAHQALDNVGSEVEQLREQAEFWEKAGQEQHDEVERLRARVQANQAQPVYAGDGEALRQCEADNERLREDCHHAENAFLDEERRRESVVAQYEQQQAFRHQDDRELSRLREENERLREHNATLLKMVTREADRRERIEEAANEAYVWLSRPRTEEMLEETPAQTENKRLSVMRTLRAALAQDASPVPTSERSLADQPTEACSYCGGSRYVDVEPPATGFVKCPRCRGTGLADQPTVPDPVEETDERSVRNEPVSPDEWGPPLADQPTEEKA